MVIPKVNMVHYLISQKPEYFVAHCLDFDIVTTANDQSEATRRLSILVVKYIEMALQRQDYMSLSTSAPRSYWDEFQTGTPIPTDEKLEVTVPSVSEVIPSLNPLAQVGVLTFQAA